jgi:dihydroorotase (multifunctional complex type)
MSFDLVVANGRFVLLDGIVRGAVGVRHGRIAAIVDEGTALKSEHVIDARGHVVLPGVVDIHVHFRDPGLTHKEDFETGTRAAAKGGVTTIGDMPNNRPPITTVARFVAKQSEIGKKAHVDYGLWGGATSGDQVRGFGEHGAIGVKVFLTKFERPGDAEWTGAESPHSPELFVGDDAVLLDIFREAADAGLPVAVHLGNQDLLRRRLHGWQAKPFSAIRDELRRQPTLGFVEAAQKCVLFARETRAHVHFVHIPACVIPLVEQAKRDGVLVTAEAFCPFMSADLMDALGPLGFNRYMSPEEIEVVWRAIESGVVDNVATDHAPHTLEEKRRGDVDMLSCPSGYPEVETSLPMMFDEVQRGRLTVTDLVRVMAARPARIAGLQHRKGAIAIGRDADLVVIDPDRDWTITNESLATKCGWTPFAGRRIRGWPRMTILRGRVVMCDGEVVGEPGYGEFVSPTVAPGGRGEG